MTCLGLMHTDRFLLIITVFVFFILCLVHSLEEDCQSESNGLAGPNDYAIADW